MSYRQLDDTECSNMMSISQWDLSLWVDEKPSFVSHKGRNKWV